MSAKLQVSEFARRGGLDLEELRDHRRLAEWAGLRYTCDSAPGWTRRRCGAGFTVVRADGSTVRRDSPDRSRVDALVIPPAWRAVWVCPHHDGHLQATGRDDAGRKQYLYHDRWHEAANDAKWLRLAEFGRRLPRLRRRVRRDLRGSGCAHDTVAALAVALLDVTALRVGAPDYTAEHGTHGLTTLRPDHAAIDGSRIAFDFLGKHGVQRSAAFARRTLAGRLADLKAAGGDTLLKWRGGDVWHPLSGAKIGDYLAHAAGADFTPKDFRTWHGSRVALERVRRADADEPADDAALAAIDAAADFLGNTRAVCREYYVHPAVIAAAGRELPPPGRRRGLRRSERRLLRLLDRWAAAGARAARG